MRACTSPRKDGDLWRLSLRPVRFRGITEAATINPAPSRTEGRTEDRGHRSLAYQPSMSGLPSVYPANDWTPITARS